MAKMRRASLSLKRSKMCEFLVLVDIDLYQWMHIRGKERAELLINYCRRPGKDNKESSKLVTLAPIKVKITHEVDMGGQGMVTCEKMERLAAGVEVSVVSWKDENTVIVKAQIKGKLEQAEINKQELLEKDDAWDDEEFAAATGKDRTKNHMVAPDPMSALQQRLNAVEERLKTVNR